MKAVEKTVGVTDYVKPPFDVESSALPSGWRVRGLELASGCPDDSERMKDLAAILVWHADVSRAFVEQLRTCEIIVRYGVGYDNVDLAAVSEAGIAFSNTPDYGTEEVADTTAAMILNHVRRVTEYDEKARHFTKGWQENTLSPLVRTSRRTLGIIGMGRIGTSVVRRMRPFGFRVLGYDPYVPSGHEKALGYDRAQSLYELLSESDVVSLHCPANEETRGIVNEEFVQAMRPGAILVNTARGSLIDSLDPVYKGLQEGHLSAVGLDVLPNEPPEKHPLIEAWKSGDSWLLGRLTVTPHTAYYSESAWYEMRYKAAETVRLFFERGVVRNRVC